MGDDLNMANNNKGNPAKGTAPNENYARELMQLFTLGVSPAESGRQPGPRFKTIRFPLTLRPLSPIPLGHLPAGLIPTAPGATAKLITRLLSGPDVRRGRRA